MTTKTIIVVDDDPKLRHVIVSHLNSVGYRTFEAATSKEAFNVAHEKGEPDLAIIDVVMPDMDGRDLGKWLKSGYRGTKILFISGHPQVMPTDSSVLGTDAAFLKKPFQMDELVAAVSALLKE